MLFWIILINFILKIIFSLYDAMAQSIKLMREKRTKYDGERRRLGAYSLSMLEIWGNVVFNNFPLILNLIVISYNMSVVLNKIGIENVTFDQLAQIGPLINFISMALLVIFSLSLTLVKLARWRMAYNSQSLSRKTYKNDFLDNLSNNIIALSIGMMFLVANFEKAVILLNGIIGTNFAVPAFLPFFLPFASPIILGIFTAAAFDAVLLIFIRPAMSPGDDSSRHDIIAPKNILTRTTNTVPRLIFILITAIGGILIFFFAPQSLVVLVVALWAGAIMQFLIGLIKYWKEYDPPRPVILEEGERFLNEPRPGEHNSPILSPLSLTNSDTLSDQTTRPRIFSQPYLRRATTNVDTGKKKRTNSNILAELEREITSTLSDPTTESDRTDDKSKTIKPTSIPTLSLTTPTEKETVK